MEEVRLWQLISDWLTLERSDGWEVKVSGITYSLRKGDWKFYIGDDYIAGYPSCGPNLLAVDPEFFKKLDDRLNHVQSCVKCAYMLSIEKQSLNEMLKDTCRPADIDTFSINTANDYEDILRLLNRCYRTMGKPLPYPTIKIDP